MFLGGIALRSSHAADANPGISPSSHCSRFHTLRGFPNRFHLFTVSKRFNSTGGAHGESTAPHKEVVTTLRPSVFFGHQNGYSSATTHVKNHPSLHLPLLSNIKTSSPYGELQRSSQTTLPLHSTTTMTGPPATRVPCVQKTTTPKESSRKCNQSITASVTPSNPMYDTYHQNMNTSGNNHMESSRTNQTSTKASTSPHRITRNNSLQAGFVILSVNQNSAYNTTTYALVSFLPGHNSPIRCQESPPFDDVETNCSISTPPSPTPSLSHVPHSGLNSSGNIITSKDSLEILRQPLKPGFLATRADPLSFPVLKTQATPASIQPRGSSLVDQTVVGALHSDSSETPSIRSILKPPRSNSSSCSPCNDATVKNKRVTFGPNLRVTVYHYEQTTLSPRHSPWWQNVRAALLGRRGKSTHPKLSTQQALQSAETGYASQEPFHSCCHGSHHQVCSRSSVLPGTRTSTPAPSLQSSPILTANVQHNADDLESSAATNPQSPLSPALIPNNHLCCCFETTRRRAVLDWYCEDISVPLASFDTDNDDCNHTRQSSADSSPTDSPLFSPQRSNTTENKETQRAHSTSQASLAYSGMPRSSSSSGFHKKNTGLRSSVPARQRPTVWRANIPPPLQAYEKRHRHATQNVNHHPHTPNVSVASPLRASTCRSTRS